MTENTKELRLVQMDFDTYVKEHSAKQRKSRKGTIKKKSTKSKMSGGFTFRESEGGRRSFTDNLRSRMTLRTSARSNATVSRPLAEHFSIGRMNVFAAAGSSRLAASDEKNPRPPASTA